MVLGPDGNVWFSETEVSQIGRITRDGKVTEFKTGISPGSKPLSIAVRDGALWFSEAAGNRVGRITVEGAVTEFAIPSHDSQPRAMVTHPDGSIWFVETGANALGRIDPPGIDGTGRAFDFSGHEVFDFRGDRACRLYATYDLLGLMKQIGLYRSASTR